MAEEVLARRSWERLWRHLDGIQKRRSSRFMWNFIQLTQIFWIYDTQITNVCWIPQHNPGNGLCHWSRRWWRHQLQRICLADDQVRQKKWAWANSFSREFKDSEIEDEIREAFKVFDKEGNGFVKTAGLRELLQLCRSLLIVWVFTVYLSELAEVMQTMGDVLSIEETEEFVHEVSSSILSNYHSQF